MRTTSFKTLDLFLGRSRKLKFKKTRRKRRKIHASKSLDRHEIESSHSAEMVGNNQDLLNVIFSKLQQKRLARLKAVCKNWYQLIAGHKFVYKIPPPSDLLIRRYTRHTKSLNHSTVKYITAPIDPAVSQSLPKIDVNGNWISQSCNGLFLCRAVPSCLDQGNANVEHYIYNPTTNESRPIPLPSGDNYDDDGDVSAEVTAMSLAFDPSESPHYKIVAFSRVRKTYFSYTRIDIYSSETKCWRVSDAKLPHHCDHVDFSNGVFLNGAIHWPSHRGETSLYFDVENECFKSMAMPPVQGGQLRRTIRFFREVCGRLLLIDFHKPYTKKFDVFQLEDYSAWTVRCHVNLSNWLFPDRFHVLSVFCRSDEDDLSLVMYLPGRDRAGKGLITYNVGASKVKKVHSPCLKMQLLHSDCMNRWSVMVDCRFLYKASILIQSTVSHSSPLLH